MEVRKNLFLRRQMLRLFCASLFTVVLSLAQNQISQGAILLWDYEYPGCIPEGNPVPTRVYLRAGPDWDHAVNLGENILWYAPGSISFGLGYSGWDEFISYITDGVDGIFGWQFYDEEFYWGLGCYSTESHFFGRRPDFNHCIIEWIRLKVEDLESGGYPPGQPCAAFHVSFYGTFLPYVTFIDKGYLQEKGLLNSLQNRTITKQQLDNSTITGACADGVTELILLIDSYDPSVDTEEPQRINLTILNSDGKDDGILISEREDNDGDNYDDTPRILNGVFTQTWRTPQKFDSIEGLLNTSKTRNIAIHAVIDSDNDGIYEYTDTENISLARPPVVMVHGLYGNPSDFSKMGDELTAKGWLYLYLASYNNTASFDKNIPKVKAEIKNALNGPRGAGYAATKVDVVAHSMGGLLVKKMDTSTQESIRKIITIGTPYKGSPLATLLWQCLIDNPIKTGWTQTVMDIFFHTKESITGGAIECLQESDTLLAPVEIPGVDCREVVVGLRDGFLLDAKLNAYITLLMMATKQRTPEATHDFIFHGMNSDWVVSEFSQGGNAPDPCEISISWHCVEPTATNFINLVINALNQPAQLSQLEKNLIVNKRNAHALQKQNISSSWLTVCYNEMDDFESNEPNGTIKIINPVEGQTCTAGDSITISVQGSGNTTQAAVFAFFGTSSWADIVQLPWTCDVNVPFNSVGSAGEIFAIGLDTNMNMTSENEVNIVLDSNIVLESIFLGFGNTWYFDFKNDSEQSHQLQLYPMGRFNDGSEHPLSVLSDEIEYWSHDEEVASIEPNGLITAHSPGTTEIDVFCAGAMGYLEINVNADIGDFDLNGIVNYSDLAILADQWLQPPSIPSADIAPQPYGDWIVNFQDFAEFAKYWLEGISP
ncbi:MAG: hypothetical protein A2Y10_16335 [Planctomycetes bacterium GWF2_41_51]|nr:MAG: hypothetical protein A2Y10_16335 [Planctomycetes bacterium GWF2_41_51]HBG26119.1 hypothetical protein [Phycisphaerales bacterium]